MIGIWTPVDGAERLPPGDWVVTVEERDDKGRAVHIAKSDAYFTTVGGRFHFDMPRVIAYMKCPDVFNG